MVVVGAFARVEVDDVDATRCRLAALDGVTTFDLDRPEKVGVLIEADDLDDAHARLTTQVQRVEGVMGVWPVYVSNEDDPNLQQDGPPQSA